MFLEGTSGSHARQTHSIMVGFEDYCLRNSPDMTIVVGDVNSTLACALVSKKLKIDVAHVEASTWATSIFSFLDTSAHANVEFTSPTTIVMSGEFLKQ